MVYIVGNILIFYPIVKQIIVPFSTQERRLSSLISRTGHLQEKWNNLRKKRSSAQEVTTTCLLWDGPQTCLFPWQILRSIKFSEKKVTFVAQTVPKFKFNSAFFSAEAKKYCMGVVKHAKEYLLLDDAKIKTTER